MRGLLFAAGSAVFLALAPVVLAHSPFDCSARIFLHADSAEVAVTVGTTLGGQFLAVTSLAPGQLPLGHPVPLNPAMATNFFDVAGDGQRLKPRAADVVTDGLEYQFRFEFPLVPTKMLQLDSRFLASLKAPHVAALVMTDENGNILGSAILSESKSSVAFPLPAASFSAATNEIVALAVAINPPSETTPITVAEPKASPSFAEFFKLGMQHILTGCDHLLFLVALLLGCRRLKTMLWVVTGFTLAHSLTLALAALDMLTISLRIVEPAIAASILLVAAENFRRSEKSWQRYALTCGFGLIHGFGFAGALRTSGFGGTGGEIARPLLAFNLGVEAGQVCVAALALPLLFWLRKIPAFGKYGPRMASALVMGVAAFWLWQRLW